MIENLFIQILHAMFSFNRPKGYGKPFKTVTHCLFDLDGTILDSETIYNRTIKKICKKYRIPFLKSLETQLYGQTDKEVCETVVNELKLPISADEFGVELTLMTQKLLPNCPLKKGAERLLLHLHANKIPIALATNSGEHSVRLHVLAKPALFKLFHHKVCLSDPDVDRGKPQPDIFLVAASRFDEKPKPAQCLVFEDSYVGVQAGKGAGMQVVMIPDPRLDREFTRDATIVLRSLLDFKPEKFGLPPFSDTTSVKNYDISRVYE